VAFELGTEIAESDLAWTVGGLCQLTHVPFDPARLPQDFPAPHTVRQLVDALRSFGFRAGEGKLSKARYPCLGLLRGEKSALALLVGRDAERLLYFEAGSQAPQTVPLELLKETFAADVLLLRHEAASDPVTEDGAPAASRFGFRWFWRELVRHTRI